MRQFSATRADDLYELITEGAGRSLVSREPGRRDWYSLFPSPVVAESILERVVNGAHHPAMPGRSYRHTRRPAAGARA